MALPVLALVLAEFGAVGRIMRADVLRVLEEDYIVCAVNKGLSTRFVPFRHALRPALLRRLLFESTINRDLNLILALTTYLVVVFVTLSTIVDCLMRTLDSRISER